MVLGQEPANIFQILTAMVELIYTLSWAHSLTEPKLSLIDVGSMILQEMMLDGHLVRYVNLLKQHPLPREDLRSEGASIA